MTNERAIELLNRISDSQFDGIHGDERREALEMAIMALEGDGDMISRQAVMKEFSDFVRKSNNSDFAQTPTWNDAVSLVGSMPSAQPERKKGKWISEVKGKKAIIDEYGNVTCSAHCSECGDWLTGSDEYACRGRFCPNCGARMDGGEIDES